jgi:hypothetical protein
MRGATLIAAAVAVAAQAPSPGPTPATSACHFAPASILGVTFDACALASYTE